MEQGYLPLGNGFTGAEQLTFLQGQLYDATDPQLKRNLQYAIDLLGSPGGQTTSSATPPYVPTSDSTGGLGDAQKNLQSKMDELYSSGTFGAGPVSNQQESAAKKADAVGASSPAFTEFLAKWGSDFLALLIGVIFIVAGIYVYKSN